MLMILARLVCSESFWVVVKVRSPHTGPEVCYIINMNDGDSDAMDNHTTHARVHVLVARRLPGAN